MRVVSRQECCRTGRMSFQWDFILFLRPKQAYVYGWLGSRVVSVLDSGAEGPGFKSQSRRCRVTVLGKLFTLVIEYGPPLPLVRVYVGCTINCQFQFIKCKRKKTHIQQCRINANRGPWQLFARGPLLTRDKLNYMHASESILDSGKVAQPATRVDTTCWQLFHPDINTAHFYFLLQKLCQITPLLTG